MSDHVETELLSSDCCSVSGDRWCCKCTCACEAGLEGAGAGVLPADVVAMVRPDDPELVEYLKRAEQPAAGSAQIRTVRTQCPKICKREHCSHVSNNKRMESLGPTTECRISAFQRLHRGEGRLQSGALWQQARPLQHMLQVLPPQQSLHCGHHRFLRHEMSAGWTPMRISIRSNAINYLPGQTLLLRGGRAHVTMSGAA